MRKTLLASALAAMTLTPVAADAQYRSRDYDSNYRADRYDRNRDGYDDRYDRNRDGNDDRYDRNRDGYDDRYDRNRNGYDDRAEGWRRWRESNRNLYRRGDWRAPFRYQVFNIGTTLPRGYWGSRYYVNNWSTYRLPNPGRRYRYIRHYDDLLLVNVRNGRVVRVYRDFYW